MELLMSLIIASLGTGQDSFCKNIDITPAEVTKYVEKIGIKKEWEDGEQPDWYTSLVKNTEQRIADLSSTVDDSEICLYLEDVNEMILRQSYTHLLQRILISSFQDCDGISSAQLGNIDGGTYKLTSGKNEDVKKFIIITKTNQKLKVDYGKNYCTLVEYTYDSIYENYYAR